MSRNRLPLLLMILPFSFLPSPCESTQARWLFPLEVSDGFVADPPGLVPFVVSIRLSGLYAFGRLEQFRVGPVASFDYRNPLWGGSAGLRADARVKKFLNDAGVYVTGEYTWGDKYSRPSLGCFVALGAYCQLGVRAGYEKHRARTDLQGFISTNIPSLIDLFAGSGDGPPQPR